MDGSENPAAFQNYTDQNRNGLRGFEEGWLILVARLLSVQGFPSRERTHKPISAPLVRRSLWVASGAWRFPSPPAFTTQPYKPQWWMQRVLERGVARKLTA